MAWRAWTKEELRLLGRLPDREFSRRFGRTLQAIKGKRSLREIPRFRSEDEEYRPWSAAEDKLLGNLTDIELARRLDRSVVSVRKRRVRKGIPHYRYRPWTKEEEAMLGERT